MNALRRIPCASGQDAVNKLKTLGPNFVCCCDSHTWVEAKGKHTPSFYLQEVAPRAHARPVQLDFFDDRNWLFALFNWTNKPSTN